MLIRSFIFLASWFFYVEVLFSQYVQLDSLTGFAFEFPDNCICSDSTLTLDAGFVLFRNCVSKKSYPGGNVSFTVLRAIYPDVLMDRTLDSFGDEFWQETISSSVQSVLGELIYKDVRVGERSEEAVWRIAYDGGKGVVKSKAWVKDKFFIILKADYPSSLKYQNDIDRFIDSGRWP